MQICTISILLETIYMTRNIEVSHKKQSPSTGKLPKKINLKRASGQEGKLKEKRTSKVVRKTIKTKEVNFTLH